MVSMVGQQKLKFRYIQRKKAFWWLAEVSGVAIYLCRDDNNNNNDNDDNVGQCMHGAVIRISTYTCFHTLFATASPTSF